MRRNIMRHNAPGETRTPNLLIRSQSRTRGLTFSPLILRLFRRRDTAIQTPKGDSTSHNNSHNTQRFSGDTWCWE